MDQDSTYSLQLLSFQRAPAPTSRQGALPCVLLIAGSDLSIALAQTVLWRHDLVRVCCPDPRNGLDLASALAPDLIVLGGLPTATALALVRSLRQGARSGAAIVVVARSVQPSDLNELVGAGSTAVWEHPVDPGRWDDLLNERLGMATRRDLRVTVRLPVWWRRPPAAGSVAGLALDLSVRGMLLESPEPLATGSKLDLAFTLPHDDRTVHVVGQVVREAPSPGLRYGVAFRAVSSGARDRIVAFVDAERAGQGLRPWNAARLGD